MNQKLESPVAVHVAKSNIDAQLIAQALINSGIGAAVVEDISAAGHYALGIMDGIHKPQVFVESVDVEKAKRFIDDFQTIDPTPQAQEFCYHCGFTFEQSENKIETCPECGENLISDTETEDEQLFRAGAESRRSRFKAIQKGTSYVLLIPGFLLLSGVLVAALVTFCEIFGW